jgi:hypothetical protein
MSTRSNIGIINADGTVDMIYCHSDGYPSYNGRILLKHWSNGPAVRALLRLGDISSLGETIGEEHDLDADFEKAFANKWTRSYARDRGEENVNALKYPSVSAAQGEMQEYMYLWDDVVKVWMFSDGGRIKKLTKKLCKD